MNIALFLMIAIPLFALSSFVLAVSRVLWDCTIDLTINIREKDYYDEEEEEDEVRSI